MDGTFSGAIDRIVDDTTAVILAEDGDEVVEQVTVPVGELPAAVRGEGDRLLLRFREDELVSMTAHVPEDEGESVQEKFDRLSRRLSEE